MIDIETVQVALLLARAHQRVRDDYELKHPRDRLLSLGQHLQRLLQPTPEQQPIADARRRIVEYVTALSLADARQLLAVMYVGRGDFDPWDVADAEERFSHFEQARWVSHQMVGKTQLAEYLEQGLARAVAAGVFQKGVLCHD